MTGAELRPARPQDAGDDYDRRAVDPGELVFLRKPLA